MKNILLIACLLFGSQLIGQSIAQSESRIEFEVGSLWVRTVTGTIGGFEGIVKFDPEHLSATQMDVTAKVATIKTDNDDRDTHLKTADFFEVDRYPTMRFQATKVERLTSGRFRATGKLTIKDVTKEVSFPFSANGKTLNGEIEIKRLDYNVGVDQSAFTVSHDIKIKIICVLK
jgi:polyisoprenoid-binding protein YceI